MIVSVVNELFSRSSTQLSTKYCLKSENLLYQTVPRKNRKNRQIDSNYYLGLKPVSSVCMVHFSRYIDKNSHRIILSITNKRNCIFILSTKIHPSSVVNYLNLKLKNVIYENDYILLIYFKKQFLDFKMIK